MKRVLFVGQEPETVDFSDPALPPGFDAEKIRGGIAVSDTANVGAWMAGRSLLGSPRRIREHPT